MGLKAGTACDGTQRMQDKAPSIKTTLRDHYESSSNLAVTSEGSCRNSAQNVSQLPIVPEHAWDPFPIIRHS